MDKIDAALSECDAVCRKAVQQLGVPKEQAMCDGPNQWPLGALEELIGELMEIAEVTQGGRRRRRRRSGATETEMTEMTTKESYEGTA